MLVNFFNKNSAEDSVTPVLVGGGGGGGEKHYAARFEGSTNYSW